MRRFLEGLRSLKNEDGQYTIIVVVAIPLALILMGLVVDMGLLYVHRRRCQVAADAAAQAAAHEVDTGYLFATNQVRLNPGVGYVAQYFARINGGEYAGVRIRVQDVYVDANGRVNVRVRVRIPTVFLRIVGLESWTVNLTGRAYPAFGANVEGD